MNRNVPENVPAIYRGFNGYGYEVPRPPAIPTKRVWAGTDGYVFQRIGLNPCRYGLLAVPVFQTHFSHLRVWAGTAIFRQGIEHFPEREGPRNRRRAKKRHGESIKGHRRESTHPAQGTGHREATAKAKSPTRARPTFDPRRRAPTWRSCLRRFGFFLPGEGAVKGA